jgi:hypothetical protein
MTELAEAVPRVFLRGLHLDLERGALARRRRGQAPPKVFGPPVPRVELKPARRHDELMKALWPDSFVTDDSLVQYFVELRRALGDHGQAC